MKFILKAVAVIIIASIGLGCGLLGGSSQSPSSVLPTATFSPKNSGVRPTDRMTVEPTSTVELTPEPSAIPTETGCEKKQRLKVGKSAYVAVFQINVRETPSLNAEKVNVLKQGRQVTVLEGPKCFDKIWWWKIHFDGLEGNNPVPAFDGWAGEGDNTDFWLAPNP